MNQFTLLIRYKTALMMLGYIFFSNIKIHLQKIHIRYGI